MRKVISLGLAVMLILGLSLVPVYAALPDDGGVVVPMWNTARNADAILSISGSGTANCSVTVSPTSSSSIDAITAWVQLKNGSGVLQKGWNGTMTKSGTDFTFRNSHQLTASGTYYLDVTLYCYKNGSLVETISCQSTRVMY